MITCQCGKEVIRKSSGNGFGYIVTHYDLKGTLIYAICVHNVEVINKYKNKKILASLKEFVDVINKTV